MYGVYLKMLALKSNNHDIHANINESILEVRQLQKVVQKQKEKILSIRQKIALKIRSIIENEPSVDHKTTDFTVVWNEHEEGYFTIDFTYSEGSTYDPFIHPNFSLYSIETEGSPRIGDTSSILYVTYKYNPNQ